MADNSSKEVAHRARETLTDPMTREALINRPITKTIKPTIYGTPASGEVWVLKFTTEKQWKEYNRLLITTDVEEHCRNLERFGATFYTKIEDSPDARKAGVTYSNV